MQLLTTTPSLMSEYTTTPRILFIGQVPHNAMSLSC